MIFTLESRKEQYYMCEGRAYRDKYVIDIYKKGKLIQILDDNGCDITIEFLIRRAFKIQNQEEVIDYIASVIDEDELETMIMAGGYSKWKLRQMLMKKGDLK